MRADEALSAQLVAETVGFFECSYIRITRTLNTHATCTRLVQIAKFTTLVRPS